MRFENLKPFVRDTPTSEVEVAGERFDLHQKFLMVGITYDSDKREDATLGFAAREALTAMDRGKAAQLDAIVLHFAGVTRFELAFDRPAGEMDYFEFRNDPEPMVIFFFEGGAVRVAAAACSAELVMRYGEEDEPGAPSSASPHLPIIH